MVRASLNWLESCVLQWDDSSLSPSQVHERVWLAGEISLGSESRRNQLTALKVGMCVCVCVCVCVTKVQEDARGCLCCRERKRAKWWEKEKWWTQESRTTKPRRSYQVEGIDWVGYIWSYGDLCGHRQRNPCKKIDPESPLWERDIEKRLKTKLLGRPWDTHR